MKRKTDLLKLGCTIQPPESCSYVEDVFKLRRYAPGRRGQRVAFLAVGTSAVETLLT
jgi:hypothetical protein